MSADALLRLVRPSFAADSDFAGTVRRHCRPWNVASLGLEPLATLEGHLMVRAKDFSQAHFALGRLLSLLVLHGMTTFNARLHDVFTHGREALDLLLAAITVSDLSHESRASSDVPFLCVMCMQNDRATLAIISQRQNCLKVLSQSNL